MRLEIYYVHPTLADTRRQAEPVETALQRR